MNRSPLSEQSAHCEYGGRVDHEEVWPIGLASSFNLCHFSIWVCEFLELLCVSDVTSLF